MLAEVLVKTGVVSGHDGNVRGDGGGGGRRGWLWHGDGGRR